MGPVWVSYYFGTTQLVEPWNRKEFRKLILRALSVRDYLQLDKGEADSFGNMEYIMRFESLADDFRAVSARLSIPAATLPQYNRFEPRTLFEIL
jgi:hypothetical protein